MAPDQGKQARVLAAFQAGAETCADVEVDLNFTMSKALIAAHVANLIRKGLLLKIGEVRVRQKGRNVYHRYAVVQELRES